MKKLTVLVVIVYLASLLTLYLVNAEPEGASITNTSASARTATTATSRQDPKGSITTLLITTVQQNTKWKAYVGNVSGILVLRDADDYSIYEWSSIDSPDGQVFMTRNTSVDWNTIQCANDTNVGTEQTTLGHSTGASDNVNKTFNGIYHESFVVHETTIVNSTCKSLATYVNDTAQTDSEDSFFQEILLMDASYRIVYTTIIDQDADSYRNDTHNVTNSSFTSYDFQAIVPDYVSSELATYYFYVEIDG